MAVQARAAATGATPLAKVKVSLNLLASDIETIKQIAAERGTNMTVAIRGAIATEKYLRDAVRNDEKIMIQGTDGQLRQLVFR